MGEEIEPEEESGLTCLAVSAGPRLTVTLVVTTGIIKITCLRLFAASLMYCAGNQLRILRYLSLRTRRVELTCTLPSLNDSCTISIHLGPFPCAISIFVTVAGVMSPFAASLAMYTVRLSPGTNGITELVESMSGENAMLSRKHNADDNADDSQVLGFLAMLT